MSEIKPANSYEPVYQVRVKEGSWVNCLPEDVQAIETLASNHWLEVRTLYPAAAYEALQKENERLDFKFKHYWGRIRKVLQRHRERDAVQAKRIEEQQEDNLKQKDLILNFQNQYAKDHAEIESLRKQVEELSQPIPDWKIELLFNRAIDYRELRISEAAYYKAVREILSASKNGE